MPENGQRAEPAANREPESSRQERAIQWRRVTAHDKAARVSHLCRSVAHHTVLEIGCREGALLQCLSDTSFGEQLYGVDTSIEGTDRLRGIGMPRLIDARPFDGYTVPYGDRQFDLAILSHIVEHLEHPRRLLREAGRVARAVFVDVPLEDHLLLPLNSDPEASGHINVFSYKSIRRLLQTSGFEVDCQTVYNVSLEATRHLYGWKAPLVFLPKEALVRTAPRLAASLTTYNCALLCRFTGVCDPLPQRTPTGKRVGVYVQRPT